MSLILIVQVTYDILNTNLLKKKWISYALEQWKNFKAMLTTHYIYGSKSDKKKHVKSINFFIRTHGRLLRRIN